MSSNHDCGRLPTIGCGGFRTFWRGSLPNTSACSGLMGCTAGKSASRRIPANSINKTSRAAQLCALLKVAKRGYQAWSVGKVVPPASLKTCAYWLQSMLRINEVEASTAPKIREELAAQGIVAGMNRIKRLRNICTQEKVSHHRQL